MQLVDLSVLVENSASEPMEIKVKRLDPIKGARQFCRNIAWNKRLPICKRLKQFYHFITGKRQILPKDFPNSAFLSLDIVTIPTHMGTHVDAPYHYGPNSEGRYGKTIDEIPIEWFYQQGVCLDLRHKMLSEYITVLDIQEALLKANYTLKPLDIVLIWTGVDKLWGTKQYFTNAPGMSREATDWLVSQGIKVIGIDTYGFDRPFDVMLNEFWNTKDNRHLWPSHFYGRENEYIQIERLANLGLLPASGFKVACFPIRIKGIDASWVRAVGIIDEYSN